MPYWLGASSPVTIATTPSSALAREVSMRLMRACGIRRMQDLAHQHSGKAEVVGVLAGAGGLAGGIHHGDRFADNGESVIAHFVPTNSCFIPFCSASIAARTAWYICVYPVQRHRLLLSASRISCFAGLGIVGQQPSHGHHESGSAEAALRAAKIAVGLLQRGQPAVVGDAFDGGDLLPLATGRQHGAREHGDAVHLHRACAAGRIVTAALGAGQVEVLAQNIEQQLVRLDRQFVGASVDA